MVVDKSVVDRCDMTSLLVPSVRCWRALVRGRLTVYTIPVGFDVSAFMAAVRRVRSATVLLAAPKHFLFGKSSPNTPATARRP